MKEYIKKIIIFTSLITIFVFFVGGLVEIYGIDKSKELFFSINSILNPVVIIAYFTFAILSIVLPLKLYMSFREMYIRLDDDIIDTYDFISGDKLMKNTENMFICNNMMYAISMIFWFYLFSADYIAGYSDSWNIKKYYFLLA